MEGGQLNYLLKSFLGKVSAGDVMLRTVHTIEEDATIDKVAETMITFEVNHVL